MDESALKLLQLECIIAAKDKEISLLRGQLAEDVIEQLQDENAALQQQLASLAATQQQQPQQDGGGDSVASLNVSGTPMSAALSTLQLVPGSKLASLCQPASNSSSALRDPQGRIFLPYEPEPFAQLLSLLQAKAAFGCSSAAYSHLLAQHGSSTHWPYTRELLLHLGLQQQLLQLDGGGAPPTQHCTNGAAPAYAHPHAEARGARDSHHGPGAAAAASAAAAAAAAAAADAALPAVRRHSSPALQPPGIAAPSSRLEWRLSSASGLALPTEPASGGSSSTRKSVGFGGAGGFGGDQLAFGAALLDRTSSGGGRSSSFGAHSSSSSGRPRAPSLQQHGDSSKPGAAGDVHPPGEPAADVAAAAAKAQLAAKQALLPALQEQRSGGDAADTLPAEQVANAALKGLTQGTHKSGHAGQQ